MSVQIYASAKKDGVVWIAQNHCAMHHAHIVSCVLGQTCVHASQDIAAKGVLRLRVFRLAKMEVIVLLQIHALALAGGLIPIAQHPFASRPVAMVQTVLLQMNALVRRTGQDLIAEHQSVIKRAQTEECALLQIRVSACPAGLVTIAACLYATRDSLSRFKTCLNGWMILLYQTIGFNINLAISARGAKKLMG